MVWFKVDDSFHSHPKVLAAEPAALGLWVVAGAWCGANLTNGFVPDSALPRLLPDAALLAEKLRTAGLWDRARGGYRFHDWADYNPTAESVKTEREAARERMQKLRQERKEKQNTAGGAHDGSGEQGANVRDLFGGSSPSPTRTRTRSSSYEELPQFDEFWTTYPPRKNGSKADAAKAYAAALRNGAKPDEILAGAKLYAASRDGQDPQYTAHATTWLHGRRWEDLLAAPSPRERAKFAWEN